MIEAITAAWKFVREVGIFISAIAAFMVGGLIYGFVFGFSSDPERAKAYREFQRDCVRHELSGADWDSLRKWEREKIAEKCATLSRRFYDSHRQ